MLHVFMGTLWICRAVFMEGLSWLEQQVLDNVKTLHAIGSGRVDMQVLVIFGQKV